MSQTQLHRYERDIGDDGSVEIPESESGQDVEVVTKNEGLYLCDSTVGSDGTVPVGPKYDFSEDFAGETVIVEVV